jgi:hypothetical protein
MKKIQLNDLGESFRKAVAEAGGEPIVIEDEQGQAAYSVYRCGKPTTQQKEKALAGLRQLQAKADAAMKEAGKTEEDLIQEILKDD